MSYSISISGHKDTADTDESRTFEEGIAAQAREFVATLEGATAAQGSFGTIGAQNLLASE